MKRGNKGNVEVQALVDGSEVDLYALLVLIRMFFFISSPRQTCPPGNVSGRANG